MQHASGIARRIVARFVPALRSTVNCSACGRAKADVAYMLAGPNVYICDRCIAEGARQLSPHHPPLAGIRCRFCHQLRAPDVVTVVGSVTVCADCVGLMETILAEAAQASRPVT
jgi:hypothetical protein